VYLSYTGNVKVGVTRITQIPTRWIDQGAIFAVKIARTPNRFLAGCIEVMLKEHFKDKTNWLAMLTDKTKKFNLYTFRDKALSLLANQFASYMLENEDVTEIHYPLANIPAKLMSIDLDKTDTIKDILAGIKGQYLIFKSGKVINIRKHNGYRIELEFPD
jgi:hypothetical protein